jgi:hypothetical protein
MAPLKGYVRITRTRHVQVEELNWKPGGDRRMCLYVRKMKLLDQTTLNHRTSSCMYMVSDLESNPKPAMTS